MPDILKIAFIDSAHEKQHDGIVEAILQNTLAALIAALAGMAKVLGPPLGAALLLQFVARSLQRRMIDLIGVGPYIALTAPGIAIHELSHAFFCVLFAHRIQRIALFQPSADGTLGFVEHEYNRANPWAQLGNFFIGSGPVWAGSAVLLLSLWLLTDGRIRMEWADVRRIPDGIDWTDYRVYAVLYLFVAVGSHVTLSPPDLSGAASGALWLAALWFIAVFADRLTVNTLPQILPRLEALSWTAAALIAVVSAVLLALTVLLALFNSLNRRTFGH